MCWDMGNIPVLTPALRPTGNETHCSRPQPSHGNLQKYCLGTTCDCSLGGNRKEKMCMSTASLLKGEKT